MGNEVYVIMCKTIHENKSMFGDTMDDTSPVAIAFQEKESAIKYIEDMFPGKKVEEDELIVSAIDLTNEECDEVYHIWGNDYMVYYIMVFTVH